jgi:hypothetical protein
MNTDTLWKMPAHADGFCRASGRQSVIPSGEIALRFNSTFDEPVLSGISVSPMPDKDLPTRRVSTTARQGVSVTTAPVTTVESYQSAKPVAMVENRPQSPNCGSCCVPLTYNVDTPRSVEQPAEPIMIAVKSSDSAKHLACDFWY